MVHLLSVLKRAVFNHGFKWEFTVRHKNNDNETHGIPRHTESESSGKRIDIFKCLTLFWNTLKLGNTTRDFKKDSLFASYFQEIWKLFVLIRKIFIHLTRVSKVFCNKYEEDYKLCKKTLKTKCTWATIKEEISVVKL